MLTKTKVALAAALIFGSASVALASAGESAEGGFDTLGSNGASVESPRPAVQNYIGNGGNANAYVPASPHHVSHKRTQDR